MLTGDPSSRQKGGADEMRNLTDQRPSAFALVLAPVAAGHAHAAVVGMTAVGIEIKGWTPFAGATTSKIENSIGTSAKGAGTGTAAKDLTVRAYQARGIPPRGRPV
jgi:hypothetical protein